LGVENIVAETVGICNEDEMRGSVAAEEVEVEMPSVDGASSISNTSCAQIVEVLTLHVQHKINNNSAKIVLLHVFAFAKRDLHV